ncbi:hypothetical protein ACOSQ2_010173 [Xanthoceras sorbifolium]
MCRELLDGWPQEDLFVKLGLGCKEVSISSGSLLMRTDVDIMMTTKRKAVTAFMNLRMKYRQAITHLNIVEINGAEIDSETKIDLIVNSLSDSFDQLKLDYTLNEKEYTTEKILVKGKGQKIHLVGKFATVETRKKVKEQQKKKQLGPTK